MPSYVLNPLLDFEEVLCKKFPSLDLREPPKTTALPVRPIGYKKVQTPLSLASSSLSADSREGAPMTSSHWGQYMEQSCPPLSQWNKMSFWAERSVSMVEPSTGSLRWSSPSETSQTSHCKQPVTLSSTGSAPSSSSSSSSSSRYKTELCRTFAESGVCKYGGKCQFAHGPEELRDLNRHPKYKTEPCRTFHTIGYCPYGIRCHFVHNNEDDLDPARVQPQPHRGRRPPLLRQSVSFPGFPSAPQLPEPSLPHPFLRAPSASPPMSVDIPELLSPAFPEMDSPSIFDLGLEPRPQFLPSRDPGCSFCGRIAPCPSHVPGAKAEGCPQQSPLGSLALGSRSLSYTSLSDHEGGSGSSVSSLSGSESSVFEGPSKRLPIFSQLSVPDDGFCSDGSGGSGFFL